MSQLKVSTMLFKCGSSTKVCLDFYTSVISEQFLGTRSTQVCCAESTLKVIVFVHCLLPERTVKSKHADSARYKRQH